MKLPLKNEELRVENNNQRMQISNTTTHKKVYSYPYRMIKTRGFVHNFNEDNYHKSFSWKYKSIPHVD